MMLALVLIIVSVSILAITPSLVNAQSNDTTYFKGKNIVVLRILNPYNGTQWQPVEEYTAQGFRIVSIIPSSLLYLDVNNPSLVIVVLEKIS